MPDHLRQPRAPSLPVPGSPARSVRSLRAPSLRPARSAAPTPHVSLIFASPEHRSASGGGGGGGGGGGSLRVASTGHAAGTSEELLNRQLERDAGGLKMGLRSRRSSSATVRSVRTDAGGTPAPSPTVVEEDEGGGGGGEGSSARAAATAPPPRAETPGTPSEPAGQAARRLNPKASATWLRWNAPPPSFPKTGSKKGKDVDPAEHGGGAPGPTAGDGSTAAEPAAAPAPSVEEASSAPSLVPADAALTPSAPPRTPGRGWRGYIWGGSDAVDEPQPARAPPVPVAEPLEPTEPSIPLPDAAVAQDAPQISSGAGDADEAANPSAPSPPAVTSPPVPAEQPDGTPGWGAYLASFVVTPRPTETSVAPAIEQPPVPVSAPEHPASSPDASAPTARAPPAPTPPAPDVVIDPASPAPVVAAPAQSVAAASAASAVGTPTPSGSAGWLHYLALRSQKRIAPASLQSTEARKSGDTAREEVMDFEHDPDFPDGVRAAAAGGKDVAEASKPDRADAKVKIDDSKRDKAAAGKPVAALAIKKKRLSVSSVGGVSGGASSPLSSSPRAPSVDSQQSIGASKQPSSLPPPPQARQPNLVIPSFGATFDRPPRSFLPAPPPGEAKGVAAATGSLAWRALGAVGSYVYGADKGDEHETRGRREGRHVGADLPRRAGLGSGTPDEGWQNVRRVVVVGVHGWFPAKMLNSVIGEPTGTSVKFATMMGDAVRAFFRERAVDEADLRLTLIPLEGEGTIEHRVDKLYKAYLSNPAWINDLRRADAIFFAAHSQGCIVTTHLVSRLIAQGHIRTAHNAEAVGRCEWAFGPVGVVPTADGRRRKGGATAATAAAAAPLGHEGGRQKVAMLAMCGVHLGPLYSISTSSVIQPYLQWFENAAARELFEFQDTASACSAAYQRALAMVLDNAVRVLLVASVNDQVVPIYGAAFAAASHPLLLRALFVDGAAYPQADFMTNLLCFALMLRNAGIDDQRLVEHLSEATAGSLTGVGHSTPYDDAGCYALAVDYLLRAGPSPAAPLPPLHVEPFAARDAKNDYELPWIMRALVDAPEVKDLFPGELRDLREGVAAWRPQTRALKEIKRRLEPMAGRQSRLRPTASSTSVHELAAAAAKPASGLRKDW